MILTAKYKAFKKWYREIYSYTDKRKITHYKLPFFKKLKWTLRGFTVEEYYTFRLNEDNYKQFISKKERNRLENVNPSFYATMLGKKALFEKVYGNIVNVPHVLWLSRHKTLLNTTNYLPIENTVELIKQYQKIILKPSSSVGGGTGVHLVEYQNCTFFWDHAEKAEEELVNLVKSQEEYIAVTFIEGHEYSKRIFPLSTNTIRIVTVKDDSTDEVDILFAMHRFGTNNSEPVDNISYGGLFAIIDTDTGILSKARSKIKISEEYAIHPDTMEPIEGVSVPNWHKVKSTVLQWHRQLPHYRFLAWDVVITKDENISVLEINRGCDLSIQMIMPMKNEKLGKYMKKIGIIKD